MQGSKLFLEGLARIAVLSLLITVCVGGELTESGNFFSFIRAVDPQNVLGIGGNGLLPHPCSHKWKSSIKCNLQATAITEIRFESLNLSGRIDAESLCKLQKLQVLSLAKNLIQGSIPNSISKCARLRYLNLSSNLLSGDVPLSLTKLKYLRRLDISNNHFTGVIPHLKQEIKFFNTQTAESVESVNSDVNKSDHGGKHWYEKWTTWVPLVLGISFFFLITYCVGKEAAKAAREREILKALQNSPSKTPPPPVLFIEEAKPPEDRRSEFVFFVEEDERFKLEDLLEATADLRSQSICSSLYKVMLKNNAIYAVKRLKNLQVSFEEFGKTMKMIGNLKHPNILPLVGYNSSNEEKLLIYKYQSNGSLLNLMENYIEGKRDFPWRLRLSIASGIVRGLDFIYQSCKESIHHGNLKLSNILLDENEDPLISEYGIAKFNDPKRSYLFPPSRYTAPEKTVSEQGDVFSFGIILLELLTGKTVEKTGIDLPKWVRAMVREEWTGEVFDKEVSRAGRQWAFPLLNVALKCVSHSPDDRPTIAEVLEKIQEVGNVTEDHEFHDHSMSSLSSMDSCQQDLLYTVIPETMENTPGSNY